MATSASAASASRRPSSAAAFWWAWRLLLATTVALVVAAFGFFGDSRPVTVGAHSGDVSPTVDGRATLDAGGVLPAIRVPSGLPLNLGVRLDISTTERPTLQAVIEADAAIAASPDGEIRKVRTEVRELALAHLARGGGCGLLVLLGLVAFQRPRLRSATVPQGNKTATRLMPVGLTVSAALIGVIAIVVPWWTRPTPEQPQWVPLSSLVPSAAGVPELSGVEMVSGPEALGIASLVQSAVNEYAASLTFYRELADTVPTVADEFHPVTPGDVIAVQVSDRHDNVGMDQVLRAVTDAAGASLVLDTGDDTSSGSSWEAFSIDSLAAATEGLDVVAVPGNHDRGDMVAERMSELGFVVLDDEPVNVQGIRFLGDADPRGTGLTANISQGVESVTEQAARLTRIACDDGEISTVLVHSASSGAGVAEAGCADLVLSGHLHRQVGPQTVTAPDGSRTTTYTNGTTGGAAYAFALGTTLRQSAQLTLITYRDGEPIGLQPVDINTGGDINVREWIRLEA
jgi:hypothetical protein